MFRCVFCLGRKKRMATVSYQFKNENTWHQIVSDQSCMTVGDLKDKIRNKKQTKHGADLIFRNIETGEVYANNMCRLPRKVSLSIRRIPKTGLQKAIEAPEIDKTIKHELIKQEAVTNQDEEKKLEQAMQQAINYLSYNNNNTTDNKQVEPKLENYNRNNGAGGKFVNNDGTSSGNFYSQKNDPPTNYTCHRCGQKGHFIQHCATNGNPEFDIKIYKNPTGIPSRFLTKHKEPTKNDEDDESEVHKSKTDDSFYKVQTNKRSFTQFYAKAQTTNCNSINSNNDAIKKQNCRNCHLCPLCNQELKNAVFLYCCFVSFCSECIKQVLVDENATCPVCTHYINHSDLQDNYSLRSIIALKKY